MWSHSSELSSCSVLYNLVFSVFFVLDLQTLAKWFLLPCLQHSAPNAGHVCCCLCQLQHFSQCFFASHLTCLCLRYLHRTAVGFVTLLAPSVFICIAVTSFALHISIAFSRVSLNNLPHVLSKVMTHTIQSQMRLSLRVPNLHVVAFVFSSVMY